MREVDGIDYLNCGDWVDSCTAIVEHHDGRLELIEWGKDRMRPIDAELVSTLRGLAGEAHAARLGEAIES